MPLYEYKCRKCHHRFEELQNHGDPPIKKCPKCKAGRVEKLISAPAVQFKGTGWYVTDYGRKGKSDSHEKGAHGKGEKVDKDSKSDKDSKGGKDSKSGSGGKD